MKQAKKVKKLFSQYIQTFIEIVELDNQIILPRWVFLFLYFLSLIQNLRYIASNTDFPIFKEEKIHFFQRICELSTVAYPLYKSGSTNILLIWFFFLIGVLQLYFIYSFILNFLKYQYPKVLESQQKLIQKINALMNIILTLYPLIIFVPLLETSSVMFVCASGSSTFKFNDDTFCEDNQYLILSLSTLGYLLTISINLFVYFFYRDHSFSLRSNKNYLRRQYSPIVMLQMTTSLIIVLSFYFDQTSSTIKYIFTLIFGLLMLYDQLVNNPCQDLFVQKIASTMISFFLIFTICLIIWVPNQNLFTQDNLFYTLIFLTSLSFGVFYTIIDYLHEQKLHSSLTESNKSCGYFLEQLYQLGIDFQNNRESKIKLQENLCYHISTCQFHLCFCKQNNMKSLNERNSLRIITQLVDSLFQQFLNFDKVKKDQQEVELISLKYISFLEKYCQNPFIAYYKLKTLQNQINSINSQFSFYFKNILSVKSRELLQAINQENIFRAKSSKNNSDGKNSQNMNGFETSLLNVNQFMETEKIKEKLIQLLLSFLQKKRQLYETFSNGYKDIQEFANDSINLGKEGELVKQEMLCVFDFKNNKTLSLSKNITLLKIKSILQCLVFKQISESCQTEERIKEIKQRNGIKIQELGQETNENSQIYSIETSLVQNKGLVTTTNFEKLAHLFGYEKELPLKKQFTMNELMPQCIGRIHDKLIENMIQRGYCKYVQRSLQTFGLNKEGFLIPISIQIDIQQTIKDDFRLVAQIIKFTDSQNQVLLCNEFGLIEGYTQNIFELIFSEEFNSSEDANSSTRSFQKNSSKVNLKNPKQCTDYLNAFLIIPNLLNQIQEHQKQINLLNEKGDRNNSEQIHVLVQQYIKIPFNLRRLTKKMLNITQNTTQDKQEIYETQAKLLKDNQNVNIKIFCQQIQLDYENIQEWERESLLKMYSIKYKLHFKRYEYYENNIQKEKINYILNIFDIKILKTYQKAQFKCKQNDSNENAFIFKECEQSDNQEQFDEDGNYDLSENDSYSYKDNISPKKIIQMNTQQASNLKPILRFDDKSENKQSTNNTNIFPDNCSINKDNNSQFYPNEINYVNNTEQIFNLSKIQNYQNESQHNLNDLAIGSGYFTSLNQLNQNNDITISIRKNKFHVAAINPINYFQHQDSLNISDMNNDTSRFQTLSIQRYQKDPQEYEGQYDSDEVQTPQSSNYEKVFNIEDALDQTTKIQAENKPQLKDYKKTNKILIKQQINSQSFKLESRNKLNRQSISDFNILVPRIQSQAQISTKSQKIRNDLQKQKSHRTAEVRQMEFEINSNFSATSNQKLYQNQIYKLINKEFPAIYNFNFNLNICKLIQIIFQNKKISFKNIGFFCLSILFLSIIYQNQVDNVFSMVEDNIGFQYSFEQTELYTGHTLQNALIINLQQTNIIQKQYQPITFEMLWLKTTGIRTGYLHHHRLSFINFIKFSFQMEDWFLQLKQKLNNTNQLKIRELQMINLNNILEIFQLNNNTNTTKINRNHYNYMVENFILNKEISRRMANLFYDQINDKISMIQDLGIIYISLFGVIFTITLLITVYTVRRIFKFNNRILLLVARLSPQENEVEQIKQDYCISLLKDYNESWLHKNFIEIIKYTNSSGKQTQKKLKNSKIQNLISSKIVKQNLKYFKFLIIPLLFSILGATFFGVTVYLLNQQWQQITDYFKIYNKILKWKQGYNSLITINELIISYQPLQKVFPNHPYINQTYFFKFMIQDYQNVQTSLQQFTSDIERIPNLNQQNKTAVQEIFERDACYLNKDYYKYCSRMKKNLNYNTTLKRGLVQHIKQNIEYVNSNKDLYGKIGMSDQQFYDQSLSYLNNNEHLNLIKTGFDLIFLAITALQGVLNVSNQINMKNVSNNFTVSIQVVTPIIILGWLIMSLYWKKTMISRSKYIFFSLTCIPFSRLQEDITILMIKKIDQF